ncbi:site-2 protease family protein [Portibacter lacus]|uniref:Zinc metalloprotease n=1 Tax=Portibacter lacus TaxID=1099794 RepID=A0AA37SSF2_9BACT|nr:site-2 protease family protein [Portibacter lacus]GLR18634.1 protease [Portibacter lacus]
MINKGSLHLGTYAGIPLKVHWTFALIFVLVIGLGTKQGRALDEIGLIIILVIVSFICVVLHEYGHALMAKRFNVKTIDIILSPIGGLARLERLPSKPLQEFYIAIAGPMVNIVIAGFIGLILYFGSMPILIDLDSSVSNFNNWGAYLSIVLYINLMLFLFNLIPAFPMDGGRILRALLSIKLGKKKSTDIASWIGYAIAVGFVILGIVYAYYTLSIIGFFVMFMARGEKISARQEDFLITNDSDLEGLMTHHQFSPETPMQEIINHYYDERARNFMVFHEDGNLAGIVTEPAIKSCIKDQKFKEEAAEYTEPIFKLIDKSSLQTILSTMNNERLRYAVVNGQEGGFGLIERYKIIERMNGK